jgi:DNA-binding HxlR family transcriptional regulator
MELDTGSKREAGEQRPGALALSLLATSLNSRILTELARGSRRLSELRHQIGSPPQTALRIRLKQLREHGVVARRRQSPFPGAREYELAGAPGRELLFVATTLGGWLASAPEAPLTLESDAGQAAIAGLAESWSSTALRALAVRPVSPGELGDSVDFPDGKSLEGRLGALQRVGLVKGRLTTPGNASYEITDWLRKGAGPIAAATRWERRHIPHAAAAIGPADAETGFLLAMPLLRPAPGLSGSCRLGVEFGEGEGRRLAGVTVEVGGGCITACTTRLEPGPAGWATGSPEAWLRTAIDSDPSRLELGGDRRLVRGLVDGLNHALFGPVRPLPPRS